MGDAIEVERKAHVTDVSDLAARLDRLGRLEGAIEYRDTYYTRADIEGYTFTRFRLRRAGDKSFVAFKQLLPGGADAVREREFEVGDGEAFAALCDLFGLKELFRKEKRGQRWLLLPGAAPGLTRPARAELIEIVGLGPFIEIEVMVDQAGEVPEAERTIAAALDALAVPADAVERRPYTKMLYDIQNPAPGAAREAKKGNQ